MLKLPASFALFTMSANSGGGGGADGATTILIRRVYLVSSPSPPEAMHFLFRSTVYGQCGMSPMPVELQQKYTNIKIVLVCFKMN